MQENLPWRSSQSSPISGQNFLCFIKATVMVGTHLVCFKFSFLFLLIGAINLLLICRNIVLPVSHLLISLLIVVAFDSGKFDFLLLSFNLQSSF